VCRLLTSYVAAHKVRGVCEGALGGESTSPLPGSAIVSIFLQIHSNLKILHIHSNLAIIDLVVAVTRAAAAGRLLYAAARARRLLRSRARGGAAGGGGGARRRRRRRHRIVHQAIYAISIIGRGRPASYHLRPGRAVLSAGSERSLATAQDWKLS
jgi:hypothetical protein